VFVDSIELFACLFTRFAGEFTVGKKSDGTLSNVFDDVFGVVVFTVVLDFDGVAVLGGAAVVCARKFDFNLSDRVLDGTAVDSTGNVFGVFDVFDVFGDFGVAGDFTDDGSDGVSIVGISDVINGFDVAGVFDVNDVFVDNGSAGVSVTGSFDDFRLFGVAGDFVDDCVSVTGAFDGFRAFGVAGDFVDDVFDGVSVTGIVGAAGAFDGGSVDDDISDVWVEDVVEDDAADDAFGVDGFFQAFAVCADGDVASTARGEV
jgi:hypothetical protein